MSKSKSARVVIIGGGIIGCSVAYHLALKGENSVIVIERLPNVGNGETARSAAMLMQQTGVSELTYLAKISIQEYQNISSKVDLGFHQVGSILYTTNKSKGEDEINRRISLLKESGIEASHLSGKDIRNVVPIIYSDDIISACYCSSDGYIDPNSVVNYYFAEAKKAGIQFLQGTEAQPLLKDGRIWAVDIGNEEIRTDFVVNAAGGMAHLIGKKLGLHLPVSTNIRYLSVINPNPPGNNFPLLEDIESDWYVRPEPGGKFLFGEGPVKPYEITESNKDTYPTKDDPHITESLTNYINHRFPDLIKSEFITSWPGVRSITTKGLPLLGGVEGIEGYINCCGMSGFGITLAPASGKLIAEIIVEGKASISLEPFLLSRSGTGGP